MLKTTANASALFSGLTIQPSFTKIIHIRAGDEEDKLLRDARRKIRATLRSAFKDFKMSIGNSKAASALFEGRDYSFNDAAKSLISIDVRFLTQGSFVYGTLVRPAQKPTQEIDLDDGIYIPLPFVKGKPVFSSNGLFLIIANALKPLIAQEGWTLKRKATCLRIAIPGSGAHIDLPLFAVEADSFQRLEKQYEANTGKVLRTTSNLNEILDSTAKSIRLKQSAIFLAHREVDWLASDPKAIHDWFESQVQRHGFVLRRLCRYSKAWRDHTWSSCSMSSLALMAICVEVVTNLKYEITDSRDDLLMLKIAESMPDIIKRGNIIWSTDSAALDCTWTTAERSEFMAQAQNLFSELDTALNHTLIRESVVKRIRNSFGSRFPDAPSSVSIDAGAQATAIKKSVPATVALPRAKPTISG